MQIIKAIGIAAFAASLLAGCASQIGASQDGLANGDVVVGQRYGLSAAQRLNRCGPAEDLSRSTSPTVPQTGLRIVDRTVTNRVVATGERPAVPGGATFERWAGKAAAARSKSRSCDKTWTLGAVDATEFPSNAQVSVASLGALPNRTSVRGGSGAGAEHAELLPHQGGRRHVLELLLNLACAYTPDWKNPHAIGKVALRLQLSTAASAADDRATCACG